jgi:ankyrin repeat protein
VAQLSVPEFHYMINDYLYDALVFSKDGFGATPLHQAAYAGHKEVAELLLAHGADVNAENDSVQTPLHIAVGGAGAWIGSVQDHKKVAELLLAHGADVNAKDGQGMTPLLWAANYNQREMAELLLAHGADVNAEDTGGYRPFHYAATVDRKDLRKDVSELLRQHGGHE